MKFLDNSCACESTQVAIKLFNTLDHNFKSTRESSRIMKCPECSSLFPDRFPSAESLADAYNIYYTQTKPRRGLRKLLRSTLDLARANHMIRYAPKTANTILDYGCGSGEYLNFLAKQDYKSELYGTDMTRPQSTGPEMFQWVSLDDYDQNGRQYDWITLSHVIEHLPNPLNVLVRLRSCCKAEGGIWLSTPNSNSLLISVFRGSARDVDFPRHRQIYSRECLMRLFSQAGFEITHLPSPRIDALMNYVTCSRNLLLDRSVSATCKVTTLCTGLIRLLAHMLKPAAWRIEDSPEIVLIGKPSKCGITKTN